MPDQQSWLTTLGQAFARPDTSQEHVAFRTASPLVNITDEDINRGINVAMAAGPGTLVGKTPPLAIKDAIAAEAPAEGMVRLFRGGGNNPGGPKWVTTSQKYAERYTTPGLAHTEGPGSFLQYVDVPVTDPRVKIPAGQSVHSFEAASDIADRLQPYYSSRAAADAKLVDTVKKYGLTELLKTRPQ